MNALRFPAILMLALLIAGPALSTALDDSAAALATLLGALLFSWVGVGAVYRLVDTFAHANLRREVEQALEPISAAQHGDDADQIAAAS